MTIDLTGLEIASASLLDEATAAAEAMAMAQRVSKSKSNAFFIADNVFPQTVDVVKARADMFGFDIIQGPWQDAGKHDVFGALLQSPAENGEVLDLTQVIAEVQANKGLVAVATDLMSLVACKSPGRNGCGHGLRFGSAVLVYQWVTVDHTQHSLPRVISSSGRFQVGLSVCRVDSRGKNCIAHGHANP